MSFSFPEALSHFGVTHPKRTDFLAQHFAYYFISPSETTAWPTGAAKPDDKSEGPYAFVSPSPQQMQCRIQDPVPSKLQMQKEIPFCIILPSLASHL